MIIDTLDRFERYVDVHPGFREAFNYLLKAKANPHSIELGRFELQGPKLIAISETGQGKTRQGARLEVHRKYIDIQFTLHGTEEIGWKPLRDCQTVSQAYLPEKDIAFYADQPICWLPVPQQTFAIFFPDDAHAPLAGNQSVHKIIMKVAVN